MRTRTRISRLILHVVLTALVGCQNARAPESFISPDTARVPESFVPAETAVVLSFPRLDQALVAYKTFTEQMSDIPTARRAFFISETRLARETGIDLRQPESIRMHGLDPQQGLYIFVPAKLDRGCLVTGVSEAGAADIFVRGFIRKIFPYATFSRTRIRGLALTELPSEGIAFLLHRKSLLLCYSNERGGVADYLAGIAQAGPDQGLFGQPHFRAARAGVGKMQLWAYVDASAVRSWLSTDSDDKFKVALAQELYGRISFSMGLDVSGPEIAVRLFLHSIEERAAEDQKLGSGQGPAPHFIELLPMNNPVALLRVSVNMPALIQRALKEAGGFVVRQEFEQSLTAARQVIGIDLRQDVLALLTGRFLVGFDKLAFDLDEAREAEDPWLLMPRLPIYLLAQVNDVDKVARFLPSIEHLLTQSEYSMKISGTAEPVYSISHGRVPLMSFGLRGDLLVISTSEHFPKLIERSQKKATELIEIGSGQVTSLLRADDAELMYVNLAPIVTFLHALATLRQNHELDRILDRVWPWLDKLRDMTLMSRWHDNGTSVEVQLRLRQMDSNAQRFVVPRMWKAVGRWNTERGLRR